MLAVECEHSVKVEEGGSEHKHLHLLYPVNSGCDNRRHLAVEPISVYNRMPWMELLSTHEKYV